MASLERVGLNFLAFTRCCLRLARAFLRLSLICGRPRAADHATCRFQIATAIVLVFLVGIPTTNAAFLSPRLGRPATAAEVEAWDIGITPEGLGLPEGKGSVSEGKALYASKCQKCHGPEGRGATAEELAGGDHGLRDDPPDKTVGTYWPYATTLFDFVRRAMPLDAPGSLSPSEVYAVSAYLLYLNGLIAPEVVLDAESFRAIKMPNRDGFDGIELPLPQSNVPVKRHMR